MPFKKLPTCSACKTHETSMWRKDVCGFILCNSCFLNHNAVLTTKDETSSVVSDNESTHSSSFGGLKQAIAAAARQENSSNSGRNTPSTTSNSSTVRKSNRIKPVKSKSQPSKNPNKNKNRRHIFKKKVPMKAQPAVARITSRQTLFHNDIYYQVGDLVSLMDHSGEIYYAQVKGLLQDQYCEKSAFIQWLLPTTLSNTDTFDPSTYVLGPTEELPRKLEFMEFECHAPERFYQQKNTLFNSLTTPEPSAGFIWMNVMPRRTDDPSLHQVFGRDEVS